MLEEVKYTNCFMSLRDLRMSMFEEMQLLKAVADLKRMIVLYRGDSISCIDDGLTGPNLN